LKNKPEEQTFSLKDLCRTAQVTERTVRYYIQEGLLPSPEGAGPFARYGEQHLLRLRLIRRLKEEYLPLAEIRRRLGSLTPAELENLAQPTLDESELDEEEADAKNYLDRLLNRGSGSSSSSGQYRQRSFHKSAAEASSTTSAPAPVPTPTPVPAPMPAVGAVAPPIPVPAPMSAASAPARAQELLELASVLDKKVTSSEVADTTILSAPAPEPTLEQASVSAPVPELASVPMPESVAQGAEVWHHVTLTPGVVLQYRADVPNLQQRVRQLLAQAWQIFK
jgi:DNA-binding transcriptional MerR regulator